MSLVVAGVDQDDVHDESDCSRKPRGTVDREDSYGILVICERVEDILDTYKLGKVWQSFYFKNWLPGELLFNLKRI